MLSPVMFLKGVNWESSSKGMTPNLYFGNLIPSSSVDFREDGGKSHGHESNEKFLKISCQSNENCFFFNDN